MNIYISLFCKTYIHFVFLFVLRILKKYRFCNHSDSQLVSHKPWVTVNFLVATLGMRYAFFTIRALWYKWTSKFVCGVGCRRWRKVAQSGKVLFLRENFFSASVEYCLDMFAYFYTRLVSLLVTRVKICTKGPISCRKTLCRVNCAVRSLSRTNYK